MKIAIAGAGAVGTFMAEDLAANGHDVIVLERDVATAKRTQKQLPQVKVITVDACEISSLEKMHLEDVEVMVAATGDDEDNLVVSLIAKQEFAVPRVIARVNNPRNRWLFNRSWGVDVAVSTPHQLTALVEEAVSIGTLVRLLAIGDGGANIVEITLAAGSPAVGQLLGDLEMPNESNVAAIVRSGHVVVPSPTTRLVEGDEVVVMVTPASEPALEAVFIAKR